MSKKNNAIKLTKSVIKSLNAEWLELEKIKLPQVVERVTKAREQGDLSENAEYHSAKDEQSLIEARIGEIKEILANAEVIKETTDHLKIGIGSLVHLQDENKRNYTFKIVGEFGKDEKFKTISSESPLGKSLMDHKKNDQIVVAVPNGQKTYQIVKID